MEDRRPDPAEERHPDNLPSQDESAPLGGDDTTAQELSADNEVEEDALKALNPDDPPA